MKRPIQWLSGGWAKLLSTYGLVSPSVTTVNRPAAGQAGALLYNSTLGEFEFDTGSAWQSLLYGPAGSAGIMVQPKVTKTFTNFSTAATTNNIEVYSAAAGEAVIGALIKHSTAFSGGSITSYTCSVGIAGNLTKYLPAFDVFQAVGATVFDFAFPVAAGPETFGGATSIKIAATASHNLNTATAGSVDVWPITMKFA